MASNPSGYPSSRPEAVKPGNPAEAITPMSLHRRSVYFPLALSLLSFSCLSGPKEKPAPKANADQTGDAKLPMKYLEQTAVLGKGEGEIDILAAPGIFEGSSYAKALAARLKADSTEEGPAHRIFEQSSIRISTVLPPGYHPGDEPTGILPENRIYLERIRAALASLPPNSKKILVCHSWGGATGLSEAMAGEDKDLALPDLAVFSGAAWSDCVRFSSRFSGNFLAIPLFQYPARVLAKIFGFRVLLKSPLPEVRAMAGGMPDLFSSRRVAHRSYLMVLEGPGLGSQTRDSMEEKLFGAGKKVTIVQGLKDSVLNGPRIVALLEAFREHQALPGHVEFFSPDLNHWPLLEKPGMLAEIIEKRLLQEP